jgi:hypothetical protein
MPDPNGTERRPPHQPWQTVAAATVFAALAGGVCGWAAEWPAALLDMRIRGAGYSHTIPGWDSSSAFFAAPTNGAPFGVLFGLFGYLSLLRPLPLGRIIRATPLLFAATLLGAVLGGAAVSIWAELLTAPLLFFLASGYVRLTFLNSLPVQPGA